MCMPTCTHLCRKGELNQNIWDNFPEGLTLSRKLPKRFAVLYINCKGNGGLEMVYFIDFLVIYLVIHQECFYW